MWKGSGQEGPRSGSNPCKCPTKEAENTRGSGILAQPSTV